MSAIHFPEGFRLERLRRTHARGAFHSGEQAVDEWLAARALQQQDKHLSATKVLLDEAGAIIGYYTLAMGEVDFQHLPIEITKRLPQRPLPVAVLAWLGVSNTHHRQGLGGRLIAQALWDCHEAGLTFPFVAVVLDCINEAAKALYQQWDFQEMSARPYRLFLSAKRLEALLHDE